MKTRIRRDERAVKAGKTDEPQLPYAHRRFIPDARPVTPRAGPGVFWYRIWMSMRSPRAVQAPGFAFETS